MYYITYAVDGQHFGQHFFDYVVGVERIMNIVGFQYIVSIVRF